MADFDRTWANKIVLNERLIIFIRNNQNIFAIFVMKCNAMKKYQIQNSIGSGNFSTVFKGLLIPENTTCAIKIMKSHRAIAFRQAQVLRKLKHPNVISLIDFQQTQNQSRLVLQYVGINTLELYQQHTYGLRQEQVKCILFQAALGLFCVHSFGIIHRDVKPENILIDKKLAIVKLIDFGLAVDERQCSTDYIATRWYRAPQNLLGTQEYSCAIDVFSLACVIVQLYLGSPLFPGANNMDQINKIFNILGYPSEQSWPKGYQKLNSLGIKINSSQKRMQNQIKSIMNPCDPGLVQIIQKMLELNPKKRITCAQILKHDYFKDIKAIIPNAVYRRFQQDILGMKPLAFKNIQIVKSNKNILEDNEKYKLRAELLLPPKIKSRSKNKQQINEPKNYQVPKFLKSQKGISQDKIIENKLQRQENKKDHKVENNSQKGLVRKTSIPSFLSHHHTNVQSTISLQKHKSPQTFQKQNKIDSLLPKQLKQKKESKTEQIANSHQIGKVAVKNGQKAKQMKGSTIVQDQSQTTTNSQISKSKIFTPNSPEAESKNHSTFSQTEQTRNKFYPFMPNVQVTSEIEIRENSYRKQNGVSIASPIPTNNNHPFISSVKLESQNLQQPIINSVKSDISKQVFYNKKPIKLLEAGGLDQQKDMSTKIYRSYQKGQKCITQQKAGQHTRKPKKIEIPAHFPTTLVSPRQNYVMPVHSIRVQKAEQIQRVEVKKNAIPSTRQPITVAAGCNSNTHRIFLSPTHRFYGASPDSSNNNLNSNSNKSNNNIQTRQHRFISARPPLQQFLNPLHQK